MNICMDCLKKIIKLEDRISRNKMSFQEALKKLKSSSEFKEFRKKYKNAFLFSAFSVLTPEFEPETQQIDFYFEKEKKSITFLITDKIEQRTDDFEPKGEITPLDETIKFDINNLKEIVAKEIKKQKLEAFGIAKVIAVLQKIDSKQIWNLTILFNSFKMLRMHIGCFNGKVLESNQLSMLDMIRVQKGKKQEQKQKQN